MSIPLDRLYQYIENVAKKTNNDVIIYRFWPHGSKKIENLWPLKNQKTFTLQMSPNVVCHDQEPLDFDFYENYTLHFCLVNLEKKYNCYQSKNLSKTNIFDKTLLVHSELRSPEVEKYQKKNFIPVYYWSHAFIALDWFRFAQHLTQKKQIKKTFLIYNRAWVGSREYRIKFAELLIHSELLSHCKTTFNCIDPDHLIDYKDYVYQNQIWKSDIDFSNYFVPTHAPSFFSADFEFDDYIQTEIEVVLETLFDDSRLHFTEKILRPIALAQPFILASTHGGLNYLKSYGFKTFDSVWDESYDLIKNPQERLQAIVKLMKEISNWSPDIKKEKIKQANAIANFNKKHFFSKKFFKHINNELTKNLSTGLKNLIETNTSSAFLERRKILCQFPEIKNFLTGKITEIESQDPVTKEIFKERFSTVEEVMAMLKKARHYYNR